MVVARIEIPAGMAAMVTVPVGKRRLCDNYSTCQQY
jgi:hypothetical protein